MNFLIDSILYSYSQIFFSNRRWFGLVILVVTLLMPKIGFLGLLGVITANLIAYYLKFDLNKIRSGFYGFNAILFGCAVGYFFELSLTIILLLPLFILITFFISTVLEHYLAVAFNLPGLSLPFIISFYIFSIFLNNYADIQLANQIANFDFNFKLPQIVKVFLKSLGLIVLQPSIIAGIMILIALFFFSRVLFLISIISYLVNFYSIQILLPNQFNELVILSSLNSILVGFAVGGSLIIPSRKSLMLVFISVIMTVIALGFMSQVFAHSKLPVFVLPFNFIVLLIIYSLKFRKDHTELTLLYFKPGTPEENYYFHHNQKARFERFKYFSAELPFFGEWKVSQGFNGEFTHKDDWKYAWDFVVVGDDNKEYRNEGSKLEDYYCYELPVIAPLDGEVVKIVDKIMDNPIGEINIDKNWGNTIILKHSEDFFSSISHLKEGSFKVKVGDFVKKGTILTKCGNSGRSPYPHIHFQFQLTDKIGEKTFKYPFGIYIVNSGEVKELKIFDYPVEGNLVKNIETHKIIKNAFDFRIGNKFQFTYNNKKKVVEEEWEVKVDIYNLSYIENNFGEIAYFINSDKFFYYTSFIGKKYSALYYFYLSSQMVPFIFEKDLTWEVSYSIKELNGSKFIFINELLLLYKNYLNAQGKISLMENESDRNTFILNTDIKTNGNGLLSFMKDSYNGKIKIDKNSNISEIIFYHNNKYIFEAKIKNTESK